MHHTNKNNRTSQIPTPKASVTIGGRRLQLFHPTYHPNVGRKSAAPSGNASNLAPPNIAQLTLNTPTTQTDLAIPTSSQRYSL